MKKILFLAIALTSFASDFKVIRYYNDMTEDVTFLTSENLLIKDDEQKKAFSVRLFIKDDLTIDGLMVLQGGLGSCNEDDLLIILLENGQKIKLKSWNEFNCDGDSWFNLNDGQVYSLGSSNIKKIYLRNGRTFSSLQKEVEGKYKNYFVTLIDKVNKGIYEDYKK